MIEKLSRLWQSIWYKEREVHAIDINGVLCISDYLYHEISKKASVHDTPDMHTFYGVEIVVSNHLPYTETVKRFGVF